MKKLKLFGVIFLLSTALAHGDYSTIQNDFFSIQLTGSEKIYYDIDTSTIYFSGSSVDLHLTDYIPSSDYIYTGIMYDRMGNEVNRHGTLTGPATTTPFSGIETGYFFVLIIDYFFDMPHHIEAPSSTEYFYYYFYDDNMGPVISASGGGTALMDRSNTVSVSVSAFDTGSGVNESSWEYSLDNTNWSGPGSDNHTVTLDEPEGIYYVYFRVTDNIGNSTVQPITVIIDNSPPSVIFSGDMESAWSKETSKTVSALASDSLSGMMLLQTSEDGGASWKNADNTDSASITFFDEGSYKAGFKALDKLGNEQIVYGTVNLDRTSPVISGFSFPQGWIKPDYQFNGIMANDSTVRANRNSGINKNSLILDIPNLGEIPLASWYNTSSAMIDPFTLPLPDGIYDITFRVQDNAGNAQTSVITGIKIDGMPPMFNMVVNGTVKNNESGWTIPVKIYEITEQHSGINNQKWTYSIDGENYTPFYPSVGDGEYIVNINAGSLLGGRRHLTVLGMDNAGNSNTVSVYFTIDADAPVINYASQFGTTPEKAPWTNTGSLDVSASDSGSGINVFTAVIKRQAAGGMWTTTGDAALEENAVTFKPGTVDGIFQINLLAKDNAENITNLTLYARVDRGAPVITIPEGISNTAFITAAAQDSMSGVNNTTWEWKPEGGTWKSGNAALLPDGKNQRVTFRVKDIAGNIAEKTGEITIDTIPPEVSADVPSFAFLDSMAVKFFVKDEVSGVAQIWYETDDGMPTQVTGRPALEIVFITAGLSEGLHTITIFAQDNAGNVGQSLCYTYTIDRTAPEINSVEIKDVLNSERILGNFDFISGREVLAAVNSTDSNPGFIVYWYWDVRHDENTPPEFSEARRMEDGQFSIKNLTDGVNYVYFRVEDAGGNRSAAMKRIVTVDQSIPGPPGIRSTTHPAARQVEQASPFTNAEFHLSPAYHIRSGITGYKWQLAKFIMLNDYESNFQTILEGTINDPDNEGYGKLVLSCGDNEKQEFYRLSVQCTSGNGLTGLSAYYQFRIDSTPPNDMRIVISPQAIEDGWYNNRNTLIMWNQPADMTGINEYRYLFTNDDEGISPSPAELAEYDLSGWKTTTATELQVNPHTLLGGKSSGRIWVGICAIDYAGNRKFVTAHWKNDFQPPVFRADGSSEPVTRQLRITDSEGEAGLAKKLNWGELSDGESGADYITVIVSGGGQFRSFTLPPDSREFVVDRLEDNTQYVFLVNGYDHAGNKAEIFTAGTTGDLEIPKEFSLPYSEQIDGYELTGWRVVSSDQMSYRDLSLRIPLTAVIFEIKEINGVLRRELLSSIPIEKTEIKDALPQTVSSGTGRFEILADGFRLEGERIVFDREYGISIEDAQYTRKVTVKGLNYEKTAGLGRVSLGFPPVLRFTSGQGLLDKPVHIETINDSEDRNEGDIKTASPGFRLTEVESLRLQSGWEWFSGNNMGLDTTPFEKYGISLTTREGSREVPVKNVRTEAESRNLCGEFVTGAEKSPVLTLADVVYAVKAAGIKGQFIEIYEAILTLPNGYEPRELVLRNFILDSQNGRVSKGPDFYAASLKTMSPNGSVFESSYIEFDSTGKLIVSGILVSEIHGAIPIDHLVINNNGADWKEGGQITAFTTMVHGFPVKALAARFTELGIYIDSGTIELYGSPRNITGLGLSDFRKDDIYSPGSILDTFFADTGYTSLLTITGGNITTDGVFTSVTVPLAQIITNGNSETSWIFEQARLDSLGGITAEALESHIFNIGDHILEAKEITFFGEELRIGKISSGMIPGMNIDSIEFRDMRLNATDILQAATADIPSVFSAGDWPIEYETIRLDGLGIGGAGTIKLPEKLGGLIMDFADTLIGSDGTFISGKAGEIFNKAAIQDIPVILNEAELKFLNGEYILSCDSPMLALDTVSGPDLLLGLTQFDSLGGIINNIPVIEPIKFIAANGYRVDAASCRIDSEGIWFDGAISAQWWDLGQDINAVEKGIQLLSGFAASAKGSPDDTVKIQFADFSITAGNISFEKSGIQIGTSTIEYRDLKLNLGKLQFGPDGLLVESVSMDQDVDIDILNGIKVRLKHLVFSDKGLEAGLIVMLPEYLGGHNLPFENVAFNADGSFSATTEIENFQFNAGGFTFSFENIVLDGAGLYIRQTDITLPSALDNAHLRLYGLRINSDGVNLESYSLTPFTSPLNTPISFWGMEWHLYDFSIKDAVVNFSGEFTLPQNMPGTLSGRKILIQDFTLNLAGNVLSFIADLDSSFTIPFLESWSLTLNTLSIRYIDNHPWIYIKNSVLKFPEGFITQNVWIDEIKFNPRTGEFDIGSIVIDSDIQMTFLGIEFLLNGFKIGEDNKVSFVGSLQLPKTGIPEFLAGKTMDLHAFEIIKNGELGTVSAALNGLEGDIFPHTPGIFLQDGYASLARNGERSMLISVGGNILLTSNMPEPLVWKCLTIEEFTIDTDPSLPGIVSLKANTNIPSIVWLGGQFSNIRAGIEWDRTKKNGWIDLAGAMILPGSFPAFLAGQPAEITGFRISLDGNLETFGASFLTKPGLTFDAFGYIQMSDIYIGIGMENSVFTFDGSGTIILPNDRFPKGLGGITTEVSIKLDSQSGLTALSANTSIPNGKLFDVLAIHDGALNISKDENGPIVISAAGLLSLPDNFPEGLKGISVNIKRFIIDTSGNIIDIDIGVTGIQEKIFGVAELLNGSIAFRLGDPGEFLVSVSGKIKLSPDLPDGLAGKELVINTLELSTRSGLISFEAGLNSGISFFIPGKIKIDVHSLFLDKTAITVKATASLPAHYPPGLANTRFDLKVLSLGWNGKVLDIQGGIGSMNFELAGFSARIESLYFEKDHQDRFWVTLDSCRIRFPDLIGSLGGQYIGIKNARFSPDTAEFMGEIETPSLHTEIAGFQLVLESPSLEFTGRCIKFAKVDLRLPEFLGTAVISLNSLQISADHGIEGAGISFVLPNFMVGGLRFNNIGAGFTIEDSQYIISGQGSVFIPGAGNIYAKVAFTTRSNTYPIGLKQAEFSYQAAFGGIPLGGTGLFISGISGSLAYGPPDDVPAKIRGLFHPGGPRIKLGLYITDVSGGHFIQMNPETWIDIANPAWAFLGNASVLKGTLNINAQLLAAVSGAGFYGGMQVELKFVRGGVEIYIFDKNGKVVFSGEGFVQFGLAKGAILKQKILFLTVYIPPFDMWLAKIGAEFGLFNNGSTGFKGFVELPILGTKGVFIAPGIFKIGNVSSYTIEKPSWAAGSLSSVMRYSLGNQGIIPGDSADMSGSTGDSGISSVYTVFIPRKPDSPKNENGLERIVFLLAHIEGNPAVSVTAPSGIEYREGDDNTETIYMENIVAFIVHSSEPGVWQINVSDIEEGFYELSVLGGETLPSITVTEPVSGIVGESIVVKGSTDAKSSKIRIRVREDYDKPAIDLGSYDIDKDGSFTAGVSLETVPDGEYLVAVDITADGYEVSPVVYAPGKIRIDRSALPLYEPEPVRAAETGDGIIGLRWQNNNGMRAASYLVKIKNITEGTESVINTGNITNLTLYGFEKDDELSFEVAALDSRDKESSYSYPVMIKIGSPKPEINKPVVLEQTVRVQAAVGGFAEGIIRVSIPEYRETDSASGYILAKQTGNNQSVNIPAGRLILEGPFKIESGIVEIPWHLSIPETQNPGIYQYFLEVINEANPSLQSPVTLELTVLWPEPEIRGIEPAEFDGSMERIITIYGAGLVPGTRVWYRGNELALTGTKENFTASIIEAVFPAQTEAGEYKVIVAGPDGKSAEYPVQVYLPDWYGILHTHTVETIAGESVDYWISIKGINGFEGAAEFVIAEKPEELEVFLPKISEGSTGAIRIRVTGDAGPGIYRTRISGDPGKTFELVTVVGDKPLPHLTGLSPAAVYTGTEVHVFGYSLGKEGELRLNDRSVPISRWTESEIVFTVPYDAESGTLYAVIEKTESNALPLTIRNRGFSLRPNPKSVELTAGETGTVEMLLSGYADIVDLRIGVEADAPVKVILDKNSVVPNAVVRIDISADVNAANGIWKLKVGGSSRDYQADAEITVCIGDVFTINDAELPEGIAGTSYYAKITSRNSRGNVEYRITNGELPTGLDINRSGEIQGRPQKTGLYRVEIEGRDETSGITGMSIIRTSSRTFVITVKEDTWGQTGKDGGASRAVNSKLPADNETAFIYQLNENADYLLAVEEQLIIVSRSGITAVHSAAKKLTWTAEGLYRNVCYAGGRIYALTEEDCLEARDLSIGTLLGSREGIASFSTDGVTILAESGSSWLVLDAARNSLKERISKHDESDTAKTGKILWNGGAALAVKENRVVPVYGTGPSWQAGETIITLAMDAQGAAALTQNTLFILDRNFGELVRITRMSFAETRLALTGNAVLTADRNGMYEYDRETGYLRWSNSTAKIGFAFDVIDDSNSIIADRIAAGNDKAVLAGESGLVVLNRTNGNRIWGDDKPYRTIALYREHIYAADTEGLVYAYNGLPNRDAPDTAIQVWPVSPDGSNGWYKTTPVVRVLSEDRETFVMETKLYINDAETAIPEDFMILEDGEYQVAAYSIDSQGLRSNTARAYIKVDTTPPASDYTLSEERPANGWYTAPVSVTLESWDDHSGETAADSAGLAAGAGVDRIWTSLGTYTGKIVFNRSGIHDFSWQAVDYAGNREGLGHLEIKIDLEPPYVEGKAFYDQGIAQAVISAADPVSGLRLIEYTVNNGGTEIYREPLIFTGEGLYHLRYRAADKAGNYSEWRGLDVWVSPGMKENSLIESAAINGKERSVIGNVRNGLPLVRSGNSQEKPGFDRGKPEALLNLPSYVLGGEYLFWEQEDILPIETPRNEPGSICFRLNTDAAVYLFLPNDIEPPSGFSFVEGNRMINHAYFPGGTAAYMKRFTAGSWVELPGLARPGRLPPLIAAQELGSVFAEIVVINPARNSPQYFLRNAARDQDGTGEPESLEKGLFILEAVISPWRYSRRLPLRERWAVNTGEGWVPLEGNRFELSGRPEDGYLRFRLELYTPDGQVEYRVEKTVGIAE